MLFRNIDGLSSLLFSLRSLRPCAGGNVETNHHLFVQHVATSNTRVALTRCAASSAVISNVSAVAAGRESRAVGHVSRRREERKNKGAS